MSVPIPNISAGGGGPSSAGATAGAYGTESGAGAWIVNIGGTQSASSGTPMGINWMWLAAAGLAVVWYLKRKKA